MSEKCAFGEQSEYSDKFMFLVNFLYLSSLAGDIPAKYAEFIGKYFPEVYLVNTKFAHKNLFEFSSRILCAVIWSRCHLRSSFDTIPGFPFEQDNRQIPLHGRSYVLNFSFLSWQPIMIAFFSLSSRHHHFHIPYYSHHFVPIIRPLQFLILP